MRQTFEIPGRLMGLNEWNRICNGPYGSRQSSRVKREIEEDIIWRIKAAHLKPVSGKALLRVTWVEPNMKRDVDNIRFAVKFILDALKKAGVIKDDSQRYIDGIADTYRLNRQNPRVVVEIEEV